MENPAKLSDMLNLVNRIMMCDHTYEYSDDYSVWAAGNAEKNSIEQELSKLKESSTQREIEFFIQVAKYAYAEYFTTYDYDTALSLDAAIAKSIDYFLSKLS
jgi:hypothetical protein